ncbi:MAG: Gx transporter family protein [Candidatus Fimivivens sp.]|nr:Gx transporter family protein [Candidatus Fimivivens sp.]
MTPKHRAAYKVAVPGLMLALALVLSLFESMLPALPFLPVGVKLGLSNIVTMYCLLFLGAKTAFAVAVLKALFVLLTRGAIGAALSLSGGLCSVCLMLLFKRMPGLGDRLISVVGAISHNIGQLILASIILKSIYTFYYLPVMILSGVGMGLITGILLRLVMPYLKNVNRVIK